ncbi:MAG: META domain-containing protein [Anaerolineales bacterium]|nr:META domain-containing protein [Anaerolineales bacterium]
MKRLNLTIPTLIIVILTSCSILPGSQMSDLSGTAWTLVSYGGKAILPDTGMTAFFEPGDVTGTASCNHYFGSFKVKGNQITITELGWTEMACLNPEGIMEQERKVMSLFSLAESFSFQDQSLVIKTSGGELMIFQALNINN